MTPFPQARGRSRNARVALLVGALLVHGLVTAPTALRWPLDQLQHAFAHREESFDEARRRALGARFVDGVDAIARRIPPDGAYYLVSPGSLRDTEGFYWTYGVRYELAPRRPVLLGGPRSAWSRLNQIRSRQDSPLPFTVLVFGGATEPIVVPTDEVTWELLMSEREP